MAGVNTGEVLRAAVDGLRWEAGRAVRGIARRLGWVGGVVLVCVIVAGVSFFVRSQAEQALLATNDRGAEARFPLPETPAADDDAARMASFQAHLLPHDDIPVVIQDLLALAAKQGLVTSKGDYKVVPEPQGGFLRYRMQWPLKGDPQAIHRFMLSALQDHPTLALESVQFKRDAVGASVVEARVQWVLLTRLPAAVGARP